jgi:signal transduction histidine kinase
MRSGAFDGLTIKAVLLLGFGLTLGLWLLAGYDFARNMARVEQENSSINARYMQAQELLSNVRPRVLFASVIVRDALLDPDPANARDYRLRLQRMLAGVDDALQKYVPVLHSADERQRVERLRREIAEFGQSMFDVLAGDPPRRPSEARTLLGRLAPRRELVIGVSEEVQALNRAAFVQQQGLIAETYRTNQRRVWQRFRVSIAASLAIAGLAIFYVTRLESRLRRQTERDAQNAHDLQRLSAQVLHAQEDERRSIARELHDEVGQVLMAMKVELVLAGRRIEMAGASGGALDDLRALTDGALHTVRDLSHLLHPSVLDDLGLGAAIDWYATGITKRHGIDIEVQHDLSERRLGRDVETAVYRIVQEALTNVLKHATATRCHIVLRCLDDVLHLSITDDGRGFDVAASSAAGLGLIGIRERVTQLRGKFALNSAPGRGTRLQITVPACWQRADPSASAIDGSTSPASIVSSEVISG